MVKIFQHTVSVFLKTAVLAAGNNIHRCIPLFPAILFAAVLKKFVDNSFQMMYNELWESVGNY